MTVKLILGAIAIFSVMIAILVLVVKRNKELSNENERQDEAIEQRDDNKHSFESLQDKVKDIKDESNNNSTSSNSSFNELPKH